MVKGLKHLCWLLKTYPSELEDIVKKAPDYYKTRQIPKKKYGVYQTDENGIRYRTVEIGPWRLKRIQEKINDLIQNNILYPDYCYGGIKGKNHFLNAARHVGNIYFLNIDIKDFFHNITNRRVYEALVAYDFSPNIARLITRLTTHKGRIPQGPPSSPAIANLAFLNTARDLHALAQVHNLTFTYYLDDLTFSSTTNFKSLIPQILTMIRGAGYKPHPDKISYRKSNPEVTGISITKYGLRPPNQILIRAQWHQQTHNYLKHFNQFRRVL